MTATSFRRFFTFGIFTFILTIATLAQPAQAQVTAFMQSVAEAAAKDRDVAEFYKSTGYKPIWIEKGGKAKKRREAFLSAVKDAPAHGLPVARYDPETLQINLRGVKSERDLGRLEVQMSKLFLQYARDIQTGVLIPSSVDSGIVREVPYRSRSSMLKAFAKSSPKAFIKKLAPQSPEYARLMKEKMRFEKLAGKGGWGPKVQAKALKSGQSGKPVVQLRNRLIAMKYLKRTSTSTYDDRIRQAVAAIPARPRVGR